jgi:hypothetical protein
LIGRRQTQISFHRTRSGFLHRQPLPQHSGSRQPSIGRAFDGRLWNRSQWDEKSRRFFVLSYKDGEVQPAAVAKWAANATLAMIDQYIADRVGRIWLSLEHLPSEPPCVSMRFCCGAAANQFAYHHDEVGACETIRLSTG